jgi:hypothetical protein
MKGGGPNALKKKWYLLSGQKIYLDAIFLTPY